MPCYNVESYVGDCLQSLTSLRYNSKRFEIVVVNDGSTDATLDVIRTWESKCNNIIVIDQANLGLGGARNTGLTHARGEWIFYVDSDDWINARNLLTIMDTFTEDPEVDLVKSTEYMPCGKRDDLGLRDFSDGISSVSFASEKLLIPGRFKPNVWLGCYRREAIVRMNYPFREHVAYEDNDWTTMVYATFRKSVLINFPFYSYYYRPGSLSNVLKKKTLEDNAKSMLALLEISKRDLSEFSKRETNERVKRGVTRIIKFTQKFKLSDSYQVISHIKQQGMMNLCNYNCTTGEKINIWCANRFTLPIILYLRSYALLKRFIARCIKR